MLREAYPKGHEVQDLDESAGHQSQIPGYNTLPLHLS